MALIFSLLCTFHAIAHSRQDLTARSLAALSAEGIPMADVAEANADLPQVMVDGLDVHLVGVVDSDETRVRAEAVVRPLRGVRAVVNGLTVAPAAPAPYVDDKAELQTSLNAVLEGAAIEFETGGAVLTTQGVAIVRQLAERIREFPAASFTIEGHTDSQGGAEANLELSHGRAAAVRDLLVNEGVDASRLTARGYGEERPVADNSTPEGRYRNRRVEIKVQ